LTTYTIECDSCGRPFKAARAHALTCSVTCRVRRCRERQAAQAAAAASLLHRQSALIVRMTSAADAAERDRLVAELDALAREAEATIPAAAA